MLAHGNSEAYQIRVSHDVPGAQNKKVDEVWSASGQAGHWAVTAVFCREKNQTVKQNILHRRLNAHFDTLV